ncbi:MAG TPA: hypothetical protein VEP66_14335 [Myxococcales bacterium]|nr:hypothetical protein [Myxococcales bacterium]
MRIALVASLFGLCSCVFPTNFTGAAKVPKGAEGCRGICSSYGMELTGMVALGEYSDGCICEVPGKGKAAAAGAAAATGSAAATVTAIARQRQSQESGAGAQPYAPLPGP